MWGFELQPLSGEAPVTVPPGETVLGRGPLFGISDKRVSRNHALLENCDGRLRLKSTHVNPCFLQTSSDPVPCPLQRDTWTELRHGDTLSLLPGHLCYKVVFNKPDQDQELDQDFDPDMEVDLGTKGSPEEETEERLEGTQNEVLEDEEECPTNVKSPPVGLDHTQTPPTNRMNQSDEEEDGDSPNKTQSVPRRRTLPSWMMSAAQASPSSSSTYSPKVVKRSKMPSSTQTTPPVTPLKKAPPPVTSSSKKAPPPATSSSQKAPPPVTSSQKRAPPPPVMSSSAVLSEEEEEEQRPRKKRKMNGSERTPETSAAAAPSPDPRRNPSPDPSPDPVTVKTTSSTKTNRTPCPYGKDCYRKNPIHFQEQSHPGDSDYEDPDKDQDQEDSDRPECPYGTDCYRKNPLHRKEFKHSKRPARKTQTAPTRCGPDDDDDEEDEYDSSFIDDDSDYNPGKDRSESESEDLSLLKTEAAIFTKKRK